MSVITVRLVKGHAPEAKRRLVARLTDVIVDVLDVEREQVRVLIEEFERENWAAGGELLSDRAGQGRETPARQELEAFFRKPAIKATPKKAAAKSQRRR